VNAVIILTRADSATAIDSWWYAPSSDSILLDNLQIPRMRWRLRRDGTDLRGANTLEHDYGYRLPDGSWDPPASNWQVWLIRIPCASVPANAMLFR
jgi:hypothetical protein